MTALACNAEIPLIAPFNTDVLLSVNAKLCVLPVTPLKVIPAPVNVVSAPKVTALL